MESCNGHKSKIPLHIQTLIPIKMHEVRRSGDNGGHNIHCDVDCQDSWSGQTQVSGAETRSQRQGLRPSEPESAECHTGVVTVTTSPRLWEDLTSVTNMMENISWVELRLKPHQVLTWRGVSLCDLWLEYDGQAEASSGGARHPGALSAGGDVRPMSVPRGVAGGVASPRPWWSPQCHRRQHRHQGGVRHMYYLARVSFWLLQEPKILRCVSICLFQRTYLL